MKRLQRIANFERLSLFVVTNLLFSILTAQHTSSWNLTNVNDDAFFVQNVGQYENEVLYGLRKKDIHLDFRSDAFSYLITHFELKDRSKKGLHELREVQEQFHDPNNNEQRQEALKHFYKDMSAYVTANWVGANKNSILSSEKQLSAYYTTSLVKDGKSIPSRKAKLYEQLVYESIYSNIDVRVYLETGKNGIKYDIILKPYAAIDEYAIQYEGHNGLFIDGKGNLHISTNSGDIIEHAPLAYYADEPGIEISSGYMLKDDNTVGITIADYDNSRKVIIDPWVEAPNFNGGNGGYDIAIDYNQNTYVYGGGREDGGGGAFGGNMIYQLKKFDPDGNLVWTYDSPPALNGFLGDLAVTRDGATFICSGFYFEPGNGIVKIDPDGVQAATSGLLNPSSNTFESWRFTYNKFTNSNWIYIGGGGSTGFQLGRIDINLENYEAFNSFGAAPDLGLKDIVYMAQEKDESYVYSTLSANGTNPPPGVDLDFIKVDPVTMLNPEWQVDDGSAFVEVQQSDFANGGGLNTGLNGIAVCRDYVYTFNGERLRAWNKNDGSVAFEVNTGGTFDASAGLDVDSCCRVYAGVGNTIKRYGPDLTFDMDIATSGNNIHDLRFDPLTDKRLHITGDDFVELIEFEGCPECIDATGTSGGDCQNGSATVDISDPSVVEPLFYSWTLNGDEVGTTRDIADLEPGLYIVTVTDSRDPCPGMWVDSVRIEGQCDFVLSLSGDTICEGETGNLTATATGGDGDYTFTWNGGGLTNATGPNQTDNPAITTTYNVTVTDGGGNSDQGTVDIVVNPLPTIVAETDTTMCIGESHTISASGGDTYSWDNGLTTVTSATVSPTVTTTYTVTGTDVNGCENTDDVTVTINPLPVVTSNDVRLCKNEIATLTATGASDYSWTSLDDGVILTDPNNASIDVETGQPGATTAVRACFEVQGVDANGCEDTTIACVDFEANCGPIVTALGDTICEGETGNLTATATAGDGNYTFTWNGGNLTNTTGATQTDDPMTTTNYTVIVRDGAGNSDTTTVSIVVNPLPGINAGADDTTCLGTPVTITATGGITYSWDNGLGDGASHSVNPTTQTTYTVTGQDENGCENTDGVTIYIDEVFPEAGPDQSICAGDQAQLTASGGGTYDWSPKDGTLNQTDISNPVATPTVSTTYSVRVTSAWGYCTGTDEVTVSIGNLSIDAGPDDTICLGASAQLQVIGGASYDWAPKDGSLSQTDVSNPLASPIVTTTYVVRAQNASGTCEATDTVRVHVETLTMGISPDDTICNGFGTQITAIGGGTYDWSPKDGTLNQTDIANPTASPTVTTTYNVHITTPSGICEGDTFVTVVVDELVAIADPDFFLCVGSSGMLGVNAPGGISYQWTPATNLDDATSATPTVSATQDVSQLYTVTVTNANGCRDSDEQLVTVGDIIVTATAASPICLGTSSQLNATGGMNYSWMPTTNLSNSQIADPLFTPTETGTYNFDVIATDGGGNCPDTTSVTVIVDAAYADAGADTIICIGETTTLNGGEGVRYSWSPSTFLSDSTVSNPEVSPTAGPITYTLTVYSEYGCMASDEVVVDISEVTVTAQVNPDKIMEGETAILNATTNATYVIWSEEETGDLVDEGTYPELNNIRVGPTESTVYLVESINDNDCRNTARVYLQVISAIRIPNVITPNGDGINDTWVIINIEDYPEAEIKVRNRWGNVVWKRDNGYNNSWGGSNERGALLPTGTYYFEIRLNFRGLKYSGDVTILR